MHNEGGQFSRVKAAAAVWGGPLDRRRSAMSNRERRNPRRPRTQRGGSGGRGRRISAADIDRSVLDRNALRVISRLQGAGFEAYFVGGCVRDLLIGRVPMDFDVATNADPRQIRSLFRNCRIIGRRFRLVHVYYGDEIIETSTFRREPSDHSSDEGDDLLILEDNEFGTAAQDARRRDFTVNGLFLDPTRHEVIDYVDGLSDLESRELRTIGEPIVRLAEDPVRILRAVKFATRLDFRIADDTWDAMTKLAAHLSRAAAPRVLEEVLRLMRSGTSLGAFKMLRACRVLRVIIPELDEYLGPRRGAGDATRRRAETFWRLLEALDSEVHQGYRPSTAVSVAVLFVLIVERECDPETRSLSGEPGDVRSVCWEVMEPVTRAARLSRREFGRARRIIASQEKFTQAPSRRFSPLLFARMEEFPEALDLFGLRVEARGMGWDIFEGWQDRYERSLRATPEELEEERRRTHSRRRRRRRRRKPRG